MQTLLISVLSGLAGAAITAYFNYKIRWKLTKRKEIEAEQRLAYVYATQLSQYVALQIWTKSYLEKALKKLDTPIPDGEFDISHAASVYIEDLLSKIDYDAYKKMPSIEKFLDVFFENAQQNYLTPEQLAKLPKRTIHFYQRYEHSVKSLVVYFKLFKVTLTDKELKSLLNAKMLNSIIQAVITFFENAGLLRASMIEYGGIGDREATYLIEREYEYLCETLLSDFEHDSKLKKAKEYIDECKESKRVHR